MSVQPLWFIARRQLVRRLGSAIGVVLLLALVSGSVLGLVAGARRTDGAFPRFVEHSRPDGDVDVLAQLDEAIPFEADDQAGLLALLGGLPEVREVARGTHIIVAAGSSGSDRTRLLATLPLDGERDLVLGRPLLVEGSWPADGDATGVAIDEELAARASLGVGDIYEIGPYTLEQFGPAGEGADIEPDGPDVELVVRGVVRYPSDLQAVDLDQAGIYGDASDLFLTPAFWSSFGPDLARYGVGATVALADGSSLEDLEAVLQERIPDRFLFEGREATPRSGDLAGIDRAISLQAQGMLVVAAIIAITGTALLWLVFGRWLRADDGDDLALTTLGLGQQERRVIAGMKAAIVGIVSAAMGVGAAFLSSAFTPFGVAGRAELDPGLQADPGVLIVGATATVLVSIGAGVVAVRRRSRDAMVSSRPSRVLAAGSAAGLRPVATVGLSFALRQEPGSRSVPVRTAVAGLVVAVTVVVASLAAVASFQDVRSDAARRGAFWDATVGNLHTVEAGETAAAKLDANPDIAGYTGATFNEVEIDGEVESVVAYFLGAGDADIPVAEGRAPTTDDEIVLGGPILDRLGLGIGDSVLAGISGEPVPFEIVGQALVADPENAVGGPGKAGAVTSDALARLDPLGIDTAGPTWFGVQFAVGADQEATLDRLRDDFPATVTTPRLHTDLRNLERLGPLVLLLAVLVGMIGIGAATLAMATAVIRRRRDLAVLRTLGFVPREAGLVIAWQATTLAVLAALIGVPFGLALGRWIWTSSAESVGLAPAPTVPLLPVAVLVAAILVTLNLIGSVPARSAARTRPAGILRAE